MRNICKYLNKKQLKKTRLYNKMLYFLVLLFTTVFCDSLYAFKPDIIKKISKPEINTCNAKLKEAKIEVLNSRINIAHSFEIELIVNGEIADAGNCSPEPLLGVLKKNINGLWDTIVDIRKLGVNLCGIGNKVWINDTIRVPFNTWKPLDQIEGLYRYTFITYKTGKEIIKNSNDFEIVYIPDENQNVGSTDGFYETYKIGSFTFHHMRIVTSVDLETQEVWERLRIEESFKNYLFDKVFVYRTNRSVPPFFSTEDFNLDGFVDFKLHNRDYFLYNPITYTFDYNAILSNSHSFSIDTAKNLLNAELNLESLGVPGGPHPMVKKATFKLPSLTFVSGIDGYNQQIDSSKLIFPIRLESSFTPKQPSVEILYGSSPLIMTDKKHYFEREKVDTVFLISNGYGKLSEPSKLKFILEEVNVATNKWREYSPYILLNDKIVTKNKNGYCLPISVIYYVGNTEFAGGLQPGRYRCKVYDEERLIATSPDFFVHDESPL
jgi:hypothetical protein